MARSRLNRRAWLAACLATGASAAVRSQPAGPSTRAQAAQADDRPWPQVLDEARRRAGLVGVSACVVRSHRVLFSGGSGAADLASARPMQANAVLYAGSLSKIFTAVLALRLHDEGAVDLDRPLEGWRQPGFPRFSLRHLLTHTAGLSREGPWGYWFSGAFPAHKALREYVLTAPLSTAPGTKWSYSNVGYAVAGAALAEAAGQPFAALLQRKVLSPLALTHSGANGEPPLVELAMGYTPPGRVLPTSAHPFFGVGAQVGERRERLYHQAKAMMPAFGVHSTADDLGKLAQTLLGHVDDKKVLSDASRKALFEPVVPVRRAGSTYWSLGLKLMRRRRPGQTGSHTLARHDGWFAAHRSHLLLDPQLKLGVAVMANSDDAEPAALADVLYQHSRRVLGADAPPR